jgi:L-2-hydroxyglutarate oxidase LhgO
VSEKRDLAVIGAGIIGLATARALLLARPKLRVAVVEKESQVGVHQTGHNSGVLHSGIYYAPGSLKATLCRKGKAAMERYADERGIAYARHGKLIVAIHDSEYERLDELQRRAIANGIQGLRMLSGDEIAEVEPAAAGLRALHAPETGVIDYGAVTRALADDVRSLGGSVILGEDVRGIAVRNGSVVLSATSKTIEAANLISCGGLQSDRIARAAGLRPRARIVPFRGDYYTLTPSAAAKVRGLIYPVPDPRFPFLGVHFTRKIDDSVVAGPNAVLALAREGYGRAAVRPRDVADAVGYGGVWRFVLRHSRIAAGEVWRDLSKRAFVNDMRRYVPSIDTVDVTFGPSGIRAQAMTPEGGLVDDFLIEGTARMMFVLNAPSPGATASLAIGEELASRAFRDLLG